MLSLLTITALLQGCVTPPPPPQQAQAIEHTPPSTRPEPVMSDIPAGVAPSIRAHLEKLRELREAGTLSQEDYESRRARLLAR